LETGMWTLSKDLERMLIVIVVVTIYSVVDASLCYITTLFQLQTLCSVEWDCREWWADMDLCWGCSGLLENMPLHLLGLVEGNHERSQGSWHPTEIRAGCFRNTRSKRYRYIELLGVCVINIFASV